MHLLKGSWKALIEAEEYADEFRLAAAKCLVSDDDATVPILFAIEARLRMLTIVARDTVRPIGTHDDNQEEQGEISTNG